MTDIAAIERFVEQSYPQEGICLLTLNRPERRNALGMDMLAALHYRFDNLVHDRTCRVVVLTGAGNAFCAGADLKEENVGAPGTEDMSELGLVYKTQEYLAQLMLRIRELPQPVIAAVNGSAVGGGLALALAADIRIAEEQAQFGSVFIKVGLSSCDVGTSYLLPRIVGPSRAAELMLTGRIFDSTEADNIGLLYKKVANGESSKEAITLAATIAANNEYGVWMTKSGLWTNLDAPSLRHAMELENRTQVLGYFTGNMKEAMNAFVNKRAPKWKPL